VSALSSASTRADCLAFSKIETISYFIGKVRAWGLDRHDSLSRGAICAWTPTAGEWKPVWMPKGLHPVRSSVLSSLSRGTSKEPTWEMNTTKGIAFP
jgi:hypothetical protein